MPKYSVADLPMVFTHANAVAAGIPDRDLYQWRNEGGIEQLARGIYSHPGLEADPDLVEIAVRAPRAALCLVSALAHHDLTDEIPARIDAALPRTQRAPRTAAPVKWHRFNNDTFDVGRTSMALTDDLSIGIYSPTRSVVDAYRLRHIYGADQAHEALKRWLRAPGNQPSELLEMVKSFPKAQSALRSALEVLL